jgi:hypothetical protein
MSGSPAQYVRPSWLPMPACRVILVCGPPASGKSTWVRQRVVPGDIEIDVDAIAKEMGYDRDRAGAPVDVLLKERNDRLAALSGRSTGTAYVIVTAPSQMLRAWWQHTLGVAPTDVVVLKPSREELRRRVLADPDRRWVVDLHFRLIDEWLERERNDNPGYVSAECDEGGYPTDQLHPWADATAKSGDSGPNATQVGGGGGG